MTTWTTDDVIVQIVKRDILLSERGSIATLNDLPDWMTEEARVIAHESRLSAVRYLRFYVAAQQSSSAEDFIEEVLLKGQDAASWGIQDTLCIPWPPAPITAIDVSGYLGAIRHIPGERWFRIRHRAQDRLSDYTPGMIGVVQRSSRYWHTTPSGSSRYSLGSRDDIEAVPADQLEGGIRRWIARCLAWRASRYLEADHAQVTAEGIIEAAADPREVTVTADVRIAASALEHEARADNRSGDFPRDAGFLGPDEWYQSPMQADASQVDPDR